MPTPIRRSLLATSRLQPLVADGIQGLKREHHALIEEEIRAAFGDSLDIDEAFRPGHEQENRWDYLLGHHESGKLVALEPHSAGNKEISVVIEKREAARRHLRDHLRPGVIVSEWFWVASGNVDFRPLDKAITRLNQHGIRFVGKKFLRKWLPPETEARHRRRRREK
jgi:hypothetical protein